MTRITFTLSAFVALVLGLSVYAAHHEGHEASHHDVAAHEKMMSGIQHAVAVMVPTEGNSTHGTVRFSQENQVVVVRADISGLTPGAHHAIHIHEFGDLTAPDGTSAGGHYNPEGHDHGLPHQKERHAGDLGNLAADEQGNAQFAITVENISIAGHKNPVIGRGVIIHADVDDGGQPTGNAGARIAMGVIGVAQGE